MKSAASSLSTFTLIVVFFSAKKFFLFYFTGRTSSFTFNRWTIDVGSISGISSVENAKTSILLRSNLIKFTLTLSSKSVPILIVLSGMSYSRLISSVSPSRLGRGKFTSLPSKFSIDRSLLILFSARRLFLSDGEDYVGRLWFEELRAVK